MGSWQDAFINIRPLSPAFWFVILLLELIVLEFNWKGFALKTLDWAAKREELIGIGIFWGLIAISVAAKAYWIYPLILVLLYFVIRRK